MTMRFIFFIWTISFMLLSGTGHALTADDICQQRNLSADQCQQLKAKLSTMGGQLPSDIMGTMNQNQGGNNQSLPADIQPGRAFPGGGTIPDSWKKAGGSVPGSAQGPAVIDEAATKPMFERLRTAGKYQDISTNLRRFGYEFFQETSVQVFSERKDIPVPIDYLVGPGDEVRIMLWGRVNSQYNLIVDRDGRITIPQIGPVAVAGMTFEKMSQQIIKMTEQMVGANIDIAMGSLKSTPVLVLGDVRRPGSYTVGSFATITDALLLAGGPNDIGSMRNVQLKRNGRLVTTFDLYNLLLKGDRSRDLVLRAGDVIFVPVTGPQVGIAGNVKRPAIYEFKDRHDLGGLFDLAGGILPTADTQQIQVSRIQKNDRQVVVDIDDKNLNRSKTVKLQDGDLVKVFSIVDRDRNAVYLEGNVKRSGKYQYKAGMRVGDVIKNSADLLDETFMDYALIKRIVPPDRKEELVPFNLGKMLTRRDLSNNVELRPEDRVYIFSRWLFMDKPFVTVEGEIRGGVPFPDDAAGMAREEEKDQLKFNGTSQRERDWSSWSRSGQTMKDFQGTFPGANAPGVPESQWNRAQNQNAWTDAGLGVKSSPLQDAAAIDSMPGAAALCEVRKENIDSALMQLRSIENELKGDQNVPAQSGREQTFQGGSEQPPQKNRLLRLSDYEKYSLLEKIRVIRDTLIQNQRTATREILDLQEELKKKNLYWLADRVRESVETLKTECRVTMSENMRVRDAILKAGGPTLEAYPDRGEIIRINEGRVYKTLYFNVGKAMANDPAENLLLQNRDRIFLHSIWEHAEEKSVSIDGEVKKPGTYLFTDQMTVKDLVFRAGHLMESAYLDEAELATVVVDGGKRARLERKTLSLRKVLEGDPLQNVQLKNRDRLFVKRIPDWDIERYVTLSGEFRFPGRYIISKGEKLSSLIERAGGFTDKAYLRGAYFTRERVRDLQQKSLEDLTSRLERDLITGGSKEVATALSAAEVQAKQVELEQKQKFVQSLKELKATGRMTVQADLWQQKGSDYDIELEDGDSLLIPEVNRVVTVVGSVMTNGSFVYESKKDYEDYIAMTGGYSLYADKKNVYVIKADGSARKVDSGFLYWNAMKSRWQLGNSGGIEPGDQIVVPEQMERIAWLREFRDITAILMQLAVTAGVVIKVF
ncbi:MAG: Polysialic acid transport protein KpsD precursor [Syntrophus sp. PtaU1.Bin208]|nr:MAG: Polysialic acid transport protein KpsD precursor [Syntrophus sp. PtaU1.Bin208]